MTPAPSFEELKEALGRDDIRFPVDVLSSIDDLRVVKETLLKDRERVKEIALRYRVKQPSKTAYSAFLREILEAVR